MMGSLRRVPYPAFLDGVRVFEGNTHIAARDPFLDYCATLADPTLGDWAEFGVRTGKSARRLLKALPHGKELHLYDSWRGLPERWVLDAGVAFQRAGKGDMGGACPKDLLKDPRARVHVGLFEDTLSAHDPGPLSLVHLDADLYSSTSTALRGIAAGISAGTVLAFDEIVGYPEWENGEYRALEELGRPVEWVARTNFLQAACIVRE